MDTAKLTQELYYKLALDDLYLKILQAVNRGETITEELVTQTITDLKNTSSERVK